MLIDTDAMFSMTQATVNFSKVCRAVDQKGKVYLFRHHEPAYLVVSIDYLSEDERAKLEKFHKKFYPEKRERGDKT